MTKMEPLTAVQPISPAVRYCGGKRLLAKRIRQDIDCIPHNSYVEPFCGMGGVFFRRQSRPKSEVINDFNRDVANFFRIARRHPEALISELRYHLSCRDEFERLRDLDTGVLTDIEAAARFFYLQRCAYGGRLTRRAFGVQRGGARGLFSSLAAARYIEKIHARLEAVVIEALPYQDLIRRYDSPTTLFYIDPPYWGSEDLYGKGMFSEGDFEKLADQLAGIEGRFILSLNDVEETRDVFAGFAIRSVATTYTAAQVTAKTVGELIISN